MMREMQGARSLAMDAAAKAGPSGGANVELLTTPRPIVKWAGGKARLLEHILARVPTSWRGRYIEPFCGGAAVFFALAPESARLADANEDLIATYAAVRDDLDRVILALKTHRDCHATQGDAYYYAVRDEWNLRDVGGIARRHYAVLPSTRAATFIYLNKTCYNGLWRVNRRGGFNVPVGDYADPTILDVDALTAASRALAGVELVACDYRASVADAAAGDLVYFDPPYVPLSVTSNFTGYTEGGFGPDQQRELAEAARDLVRRGCHVILSNSDTPIVRDLYAGDDFEIASVSCARAINSKGKARGAVSELLITGRV